LSTIKTPREKKDLSLARDRRNVFRENSKASRKNIPKAKQRRQMNERRSVAQLLGTLGGQEVEEDDATAVELKVKGVIADSKNRGFKKTRDEPLAEILKRKAAKKRRKT
jgi:hypothetical protein